MLLIFFHNILKKYLSSKFEYFYVDFDITRFSKELKTFNQNKIILNAVFKKFK